MESIINSIISNYLADYLEINPEKTKLSVLTGTVDLFGVKFRKNLFTTLNLPYLELVDGYVGRIHVNLKLPRFYLYPINVDVDKIYVKVKPKNMNKIPELEILKIFEIFKKKKLKQFEELMNIKFSFLSETEEEKEKEKEEEKKKEKSNQKKDKKKEKKEKVTMVEKIINNLHIKIQNVVFIFDDCVSNPKYPITFGVTLNEIAIDSTSKDFVSIKLSEEEKKSPLKYKKLSINGINIFLDNIKKEDLIVEGEESYTKLNIREETRINLNEKEKNYLGNSIDFYLYCESEMGYYCKDPDYHNYLLRDLNLDIKLVINEKYLDEKNKDPQISGVIDIKTVSLEISNKQIKSLTNITNYLTLNNFYQQTTIDNHFKEIEKIDNDLIKNYLEEYTQYYKTKYIDIYKNEKENKKFLANMEKIEKNLRLDSITTLREMGNDVINSMIEIGKIDKELKVAKGGFLGYFKSKNSAEIDKLKLERDKKIKEQKELQEKNSTMNQFKDFVSSMLKGGGEGDKSKEEKTQFVFMLMMEQLNLIIKEEKKDEKMKKIFEINLIKFEAQIIIKTISQFIKLSLNDMKFSQFLSANKNYEMILYSQNILEEKKDDRDVSLISVIFEHNLKFPISPFKFRLLFGKQMYIIIDYYYLFYLYNLFLKHISAIDFNNLSSLVNEKITNIVKISYDNLVKNRAIEKEKEENNTKLFNIHVDISLTAPILLFPLYFRDANNKEMLYISLGKLKIKSELADDANDEKAIYDKYIVEFSDFIMKTIDIYDSKLIVKEEIGEKIIYESSFNVDLQNYIFQKPKKMHKTEDFSPLLININLNNIKVSLCEEQIVFLINYLENFMRTRNEFEREKQIKIEKKQQNQKKEKIPLFGEDKTNEVKNKDKNKIPLFGENKTNEIKKIDKIPLFGENKTNEVKNKDKIPLFGEVIKNDNKNEDVIPLFEEDNEDEKKEKIPLFSEVKKNPENEIKQETNKDNDAEKDTKADIAKEIITNENEKGTKDDKQQEITNVIKLSIKFGSVQLFLVRNLDKTKKIDFLTFFFKESFLNLLMKSNNSLNMEMSFGHFCLCDEDKKIKESTRKEEPAINPEFRFIAGTTPFDFKTPTGNKVKLSEIYNYKTDENSKNNLVKESIKLNLNLDSVNNNMDIYISMCKLTISPNLSTIIRAYTFLFKYLNIFNESNIKLKYEQLKEQMNDKKPEKLDLPPAAPIANKNINDDKNKDANKDKLIKTREKSVMHIYFSMEGINLLFPVDVDSKNTFIIFMSLEMPINIIIRTDGEFFYRDSKLIKIDYLNKTMQFTLYIKEGNFSIYEYKDDFILLNSKNKIFENFTSSLLLNNQLDRKGKINKNDLVINLNKETEFSININQIIIFQDLMEKVNEFLKELNKDITDKIVLNKKQEFLENEEFVFEVKKSIISARESQEEIEKLKRQELKKLYPISYNDIYNYDINFANLFIKFYDIIDGTYQPLFEFSMKDTKVEFFQNSNPQDSTNLINYLKSTFSKDDKNKPKLDTYDKNNFYMYFNIVTYMEIKSLNSYLNQWEYFVEPITVDFYFCQFLKRMRPNIELFIDNMLNINISLNFAQILQFTLKKFSLNKEEIKKKKNETSGETETIMDNGDTPRYIGYETPMLILENYSGVDMDIWFDNKNYNKDNNNSFIRIKSDEKFELTMDILTKYKIKINNNNLSSTISYKFCLEQDFINNMSIDEKKLIGNNFNLNYHHLEIHDITNTVKVSVESFSDNLLIRHVVFSSLVSIKNETKFADLEIIGADDKAIKLNTQKRQMIPISWLLNKTKRNVDIKLKEKVLFIKDLNEIDHISRVIQIKNETMFMIDVIKLKFNLDEYYINKNITNKKDKVDIYRIDLIITAPIYFLNSTPYDFIINTNEKIASTKSISSYPQNTKLFLDYRQTINNQDKKAKFNKYDAIMKVLKDIRFQIFYNNNYMTANTYLAEKKESVNVDQNEDGQNINNFSFYNKSILILLKNNNPKDFLICRLILNNPYKSLSFDNKIYKETNIELNSFRYEIIFDYYIVNKTFTNLYLNNKYLKIVEASKENMLISAKQFIPVANALLNEKTKFRKTKKDWTENFEFSALGKEFVLNVKNENKTYQSISVNAKVSTTFKKSIIFTIEDKFIVINELPFDILIKEEKQGTLIQYKSRESNIFLLDKETLEKKSRFRVGFDDCYSHIFDISKLGSFDLLIEYKKKTFEKFKINPEDKLVEYNSCLYYPIRCVINTLNKNTIYIIFSLNHQYINQLRNCTSQTIKVLVQDNKTEMFRVRPEMTIPLVYVNKKNKYKPFENVEIIFSETTKAKVNINEIATKYCGKEKDFFYIRIRPEKNNSVKSIILYGNKDDRLKEEISIKKRIKKYTQCQGAKILLNLEGIGFSLIDETPKELFYLSFYKIFLKYNYSNCTNILNEMDFYNSLTFSITNMELDYCLEDSYDIVFNPTNQILPPKFGEKIKTEKNFLDKVMENGDEDTPFIQFVFSQRTVQEKIDNKIKIIYMIFPEIGIIIQEFDVRINTILINCLINLISKYIKIFVSENEYNDDIDANKIDKEKKISLVEDQYSLDDIRNKLLNKGENVNNLIINCLTLSAIKVNTTFKINKNAIDIKFIPELFITILNTLCSTLASFSDVTIKLSELTFLNVFSDYDSLYIKLYTFYKNKLLAQIYKIIFNMDLIGNPVNLIEGLGTGLFQFFNEPRKGILRGPEEFGIGIARGTRSLVANIVGGGFSSVSKITGTLLNASKNLSSLGTKEEIVVKEEEKPRGLIKGTISGLKKGFGELAHGVTGIVTKPIEQTKKSGAKGFFKGLGSGLLGAVLSPVNTVLTVGNEVSSGISNSELISNKKSLRRFRLPRTLFKYIPILPYSEEDEIKIKEEKKGNKGSGKNEVSLSNELLYLENSTKIVMHTKLIDGNILIFTNIMIKIVSKDFNKFIQKLYLCNIEKVVERNDIQLIMKNSENHFFRFMKGLEQKDFVKEIEQYLKKENE